MTVRGTLYCQLKPGSVESLTPFLAENLPNVRGFNGCMSVKVFFDIDQKEMLLEEEWISLNQHKEYMKYITDNGVLAELASFFEQPPVVKYFEKEMI